MGILKVTFFTKIEKTKKCETLTHGDFDNIFEKKNGKWTFLDDFQFHKYADLDNSFTEIGVLTTFLTKTAKWKLVTWSKHIRMNNIADGGYASFVTSYYETVLLKNDT